MARSALAAVIPGVALAVLGGCASDEREWPFLVAESSGVTIVTELSVADEGGMRNATMDYGTFLVRNDCLHVRLESGLYTSVLPEGASISSDRREIVVKGQRLRLGKEYALPFASQVGLVPEEAAKSIGLPDRCTQRLLTMGVPV